MYVCGIKQIKPMSVLSDRIESLEESATIAMSQKSRDLKAQGKDIISLSLGEPDYNTPDFVKKAANEAIAQNYTKYMPVPGYQDFRESIAKKFKRDNGLDYAPSQIVVSTGAKQSIANVVLSTVNPGDEVLIPAPYWVTYKEIVKMAEGIPVIVEAGIEQEFKLTAEQLDQAITDNTKLIIFSNPCNPTGAIYSKDELSAWADVISHYPNLLIISDEIYEHITFDGKHESFAQFDRVYNQTITINGVSKAFAMTGWRIGYMGAPQHIADACIKMQGQFTSGASGIAQRAAKAAIDADSEVTNDMVASFSERRKLVLELLNGIEGVKNNEPGGAFYIFPDVSYFFGKSNGSTTIHDASDVAMYILEEGHVATVTGEAFGDPNCIRISYAASEKELKEALSRMKNVLDKLQ